MVIFHLATVSDWTAAAQSGSYTTSTRGRTYAEEGYIHASTETQIDTVAGNFYADVTEPLVLLTIDPELVAAAGVEIRYELPVPDAEEKFPHIYGPISPQWVVAVQPVQVENGALRPV